MEKEMLVGIKPLDRNDSLKAVATVTFLVDGGQELTVPGFRIHQKDDKRLWVNFPQTSYTKNGETKYQDVIKPAPRLRDLIETRIAEEYRRFNGVKV